MAKFTSYHLMGGQLYYSKTGKAVPLKYVENLKVDIKKRTVYKNGRKVGTLKQKNLTKKAVTTLKRNVKRTKRVGLVKSSLLISKDSPGPSGGVSRETQNAINFSSACLELVQLKSITYSEYQELVGEYVTANDARKSELWAYVHSLFEDYAIVYKTIGWTE